MLVTGAVADRVLAARRALPARGALLRELEAAPSASCRRARAAGSPGPGSRCTACRLERMRGEQRHSAAAIGVAVFLAGARPAQPGDRVEPRDGAVLRQLALRLGRADRSRPGRALARLLGRRDRRRPLGDARALRRHPRRSARCSCSRFRSSTAGCSTRSSSWDPGPRLNPSWRRSRSSASRASCSAPSRRSRSSSSHARSSGSGARPAGSSPSRPPARSPARSRRRSS